MTAVAVFSDENVGGSLRPIATLLVEQPLGQFPISASLLLHTFPSGLFQNVAHLALESTIVAGSALLQPAYDFVIHLPNQYHCHLFSPLLRVESFQSFQDGWRIQSLAVTTKPYRVSVWTRPSVTPPFGLSHRVLVGSRHFG